jgi:hypothetical protein
MKPSVLRIGTAALALALLLASAPAARAETISLVRNPSGVSVSYTDNGTPTTSTGGIFSWTQTTPLNTNFNSAVPTYCIELDQGFGSNPITYTVQTNLAAAPTIGTASKATAITSLFDRFYNSTIGNTTRQAAFQLALWDILYDGAPSTSINESASGRIRYSNSTTQTMLDAIANNTAYSNGSLAGNRLVALVNGTSQDQLTVDPNPTPGNPVPAPPALALAGIAFAALAGRSRALKRKA